MHTYTYMKEQIGQEEWASYNLSSYTIKLGFVCVCVYMSNSDIFSDQIKR